MVNFAVIWYISPIFGMFYHTKSGNPGPRLRQAVENEAQILLHCFERLCGAFFPP
jgi:hypothetical protein